VRRNNASLLKGIIMRGHLGFLSILLAFAVVGTAALSSDRPSGYLAPGDLDITHVLEPAPRPGDPRYETDRKIFRETRKFIGTPRWTLATSDADYGVPALLHDFSCSVGVVMTPDNSPKLAALVQRAGADTGAQSGKAKDFYHRQRPYVIDQGQICQPRAELYDQKRHQVSYDYPSGHTTWGWTWALILSNLAPDRARQILERGRAYGDSRFICGAHNESAVEAGMLSATATMAVVQTKPAYQSDLAAARAEFDTLRANGQRPTGCDAEEALISKRVMPRLER
jgi:acid phosphatase (class A)